MKKPHILFTTSCKPYPKKFVKYDDVDYFYYRNTLGQGPFQLKQRNSWHPLHFIAQNIDCLSLVIENPTMRSFQKELKTGTYDILAIAFTITSAGNVLHMLKIAKQMFPDITVILGGYGASVFKEDLPIKKELEAYVDEICYDEGVSFFRNYLERKWNITNANKPLKQDLRKSEYSLIRSPFILFKQSAFLRSLGCQNGCSFCTTSHFFNCKKITLFSTEELYAQIKKESLKDPYMQNVIIYDENLLADREGMLRFMKLIENDEDLQSRPLLLTVFASVESISKYSMEELVRCCIGTLFIGVESLCKDILKDEGMHKRGNSDVKTLFRNLQQHGISTLASLIIGWDGHTEENIKKEIESFAELNPTLYQAIPLHPTPGTPLWKRLKTDNRINPDYSYDKETVRAAPFKYKNFTQDRINHIVSHAYKSLSGKGGPWPLRSFNVYFDGAQFLKKQESDFLVKKSSAYNKMAWIIGPFAFVSLFFAINNVGTIKAWFKTMVKKVLRQKPLMFISYLLVSPLVFAFILITYIIGQLKFLISPWGEQPKTYRTKYDPE